MASNKEFYRNLPGHAEFDAFFSSDNVSALPDDWLVIIADIENSTVAVQDGLYREVNAIGVATIVAMMKAADDIAVPYVFGGDGASFCIPPAILPAAEEALVITKTIARLEFGLSLRIGIVPVKDIRDKGADILIGKYKPSEHYEQAMFSGHGLSMADSMVKDILGGRQYRLHEAHINPASTTEYMSGFECRWDEIPGQNTEVVNILIQVCEGHEGVYSAVIHEIRRVYGCKEKCYPINPKNMQLSLDNNKLSVETRIRAGLMPWYIKIPYLFKLKLIVLLGRFLMKHEITTGETQWGEYKKRLIENTDVQRFDDTLRMMVSGNADQRKQLTDLLEQHRQNNVLAYGIHVTTHSLVTCMIDDYNHQHVHFIDGKGGGYTLAAVQLKQQTKEMKK